MERRKKTGLLLAGIILGLCTITAFEPVFSKNSAKTEQEITDAAGAKKDSSEELSTEDIKVNRETLDKASELMTNKDFAGALPYLNAYITSKPKKYQGYKLRGEAYYALRRYNDAVNDFQRAVDIKTDDDKFATGTKVFSAVVLGADKMEQYQNPELGILYGELMYAQKAVNDNMYEVSYKKATEYNSHQYLPEPKKSEISKINCPQKYGKVFNPQGVDADIAAVIEDIEKGKYTEAVYTLPKITSAYPDYYLGYYLTGVVMSGLEQEDEAVSSFKKAISLNPYDFESYASLGLLYYREAEKTFDTKYSDLSVENFQKAIKLNPNCNTYYYYIGLNDMLESNYAGAVENFKKAIDIKNNDYNSRYYKSVAMYMNGDYEGSINESTNLIYRRVSNYNSVLYLRALAYYKMKNYESSIADIEKIHHNMDDIYNADVKKLSAKEQTLESYLYYLQSKIARDNGTGAKSDLEKAYKNPVIALLDKRNRDFGHANYKMTSFDIDSQYDYLRTTFDELGLGFEYLNPDYKIVQKEVKTPVAAKPQSALSAAETLVNGTTDTAVSEEISAPSQRLAAPTAIPASDEAALAALLKDKEIKETEQEKLSPAPDAAKNETSNAQKTIDTEKITLAEPEIVSEQVKKEIAQNTKSLTEAATDANLTNISLADILSQKDSTGTVVEVEEIPAAEKTTNAQKNESAGADTETPVTLEIPQETLKQKISEKYGERAVSTPAKTDLIPAKKSKPAVMVFDPDTLIFDPVEENETTGTSLTPDNSARIKSLLESENNINGILETSAVSTTEPPITIQSAKGSDTAEKSVSMEKEPTAEQKLTEIKEKTINEDIKPVAEITDKNRTQEVSEPVLPVLRGTSSTDDTAAVMQKTTQNYNSKTLNAVPEEKINRKISDAVDEIEPAKGIEKDTSADTADLIPDAKTGKIIVENIDNTVTSSKEKIKQTEIKEETPSIILDAEPSVKNYVEDVSAVSKSLKVPVKEKYADVNLKEFNVKNKIKPDVNDDDEIIFLDTTSDSFMQRAEQQMNENYEEILQTSSKEQETVKEEVNQVKTGNKHSAADEKSVKSETVEPVDVNITKTSDNLKDSVNSERHQEPELAEIQDIIIPKKSESSIKNVSHSKNTKASEQPEAIQKEEASVNDTSVPELKEPDESSQRILPNDESIVRNSGEISTTAIEKTSSKKARKEKQKTEDNLVLAVGGDAEKYMNKEDKSQKVKKDKSVKDKKTAANKAEDQPQKEDTASNVEKTGDIMENISEKTDSNFKQEETSEKAKNTHGEDKKDSLTEQHVPVSVDTDNNENNASKNDDKQNGQNVEKPKKQSFFRRLFSRKKVKTEELEAAPIPQNVPEVTEEEKETQEKE